LVELGHEFGWQLEDCGDGEVLLASGLGADKYPRLADVRHGFAPKQTYTAWGHFFRPHGYIYVFTVSLKKRPYFNIIDY
jgi:hypothetical protein